MYVVAYNFMKTLNEMKNRILFCIKGLLNLLYSTEVYTQK